MADRTQPATSHLGDYPGDEEARRLIERRPPGCVDDDEDARVDTREPAPIAVLDWQVPIDDSRKELHDIGAFRGDETDDIEDRDERHL